MCGQSGTFWVRFAPERGGLVEGHCRLKPVSFIKPIGAENEHPGYASEHTGSDHLVDLLQAVQRLRCAKDTMVVVTYDDFGGQWDRVFARPGPHHPGAARRDGPRQPDPRAAQRARTAPALQR